MAKKSIRREDFDEAAILNLIGGVDAPPRFVPKAASAPPPPETPPPERHEPPTEKPDADTIPKKAKGTAESIDSEYKKRFLKPRKCPQESTCRVATETYENLSLIVRLLGGNGTTVKSYVNNILDAHLEQYLNDINKLISNAKIIKL